MIQVRKEHTAPEYISGAFLDKIDFHDTFATSNHENNLNEIAHLVFDNPPKWVSVLFNLRNKLVKFFGLKTEKPADYNEAFVVGGYIGFFKIYSFTDTEIVMGANDSHLNFRAIIVKIPEPFFNIKVITLVQFNNSFGKIYMRMIEPFHRLVLKRMVKNAYKMQSSRA